MAIPLLAHAQIDRVQSFDEYRRSILALAADAKNDVMILAMAASDYGPKAVEGKISSDNPSLTLELEALPKIISFVKKERPDIFLVGFKLLVNVPPDQLIERAYESMLRDKQDLAVANVGRNSMRPSELLTYIITAERGIVPVPRDELPERLAALIEQRHSRAYYHTNLTKVPELPVPSAELAEFVADTKRLAHLAIFNSYTATRREEFGFVAKRTAGGTLITGRGSSKTDATADEVSLVTAVDPEERSLAVVSTGKKASLNASLAHLIFEARPEINYIVHAHIPLPEAVSTGRDSSPATAEDWSSMEGLVKAGHDIIEQPHHGVMILLRRLDDIYPLLERNSVYRAHPDHYDTAYHRFLKSPRLVELVRRSVPEGARVLDLAAGTGEVTLQLLAAGYGDITLADASPRMLEVAKGKVGRLLGADRFVIARMEALPFHEEFDAIVVRQAINYISPSELEAALRGMRSSLPPGGALFFNSFDPDTAEDRTFRHVRDEIGNKILLTYEGNLVDGKKIYHGQRTEMYDSFSGDYELIYDLNSFWGHTAAEFERAARAAGFSDVQIEREGHSIYAKCVR
jgi:ubiquinone/menaquinone biosynthesis C-methylase UbiE